MPEKHWSKTFATSVLFYNHDKWLTTKLFPFFSAEIVPRDADMKGKFIQHFTGEGSDTKFISLASNVRQLA